MQSLVADERDFRSSKFAVVLVTASDAMDLGGFTDCVVFLR